MMIQLSLKHWFLRKLGKCYKKPSIILIFTFMFYMEMNIKCFVAKHLLIFVCLTVLIFAYMHVVILVQNLSLTNQQWFKCPLNMTIQVILFLKVRKSNLTNKIERLSAFIWVYEFISNIKNKPLDISLLLLFICR